METDLISLFLICACSLIAPIISNLLPNKVIPETVFLLILGMLFGPHVLNVIDSDNAIGLLSDLGLGFLFLMAGYEIDVKELSGKGGRAGLATWFASFAIALAICLPVGNLEGRLSAGIATAIILTTTAFGTLVPILKDRGLTGTPMGNRVVEYGVWGELCPVIAMALMLSTRATWVTILFLLAFVVIAVLSALLSRRAQREGSKTFAILRDNAENNSQLTLRITILLLVGLVTLSDVFGLDIVLGAFAAGFVLRTVLPNGDPSLEHKLNGIAYGFFIPLFFVVSGLSINPAGVFQEPLVLVLFIVMLVAVRMIPIYASLAIRKDTKDMSTREKTAVSLYCTTALPLIVAVCSVAVSSGTFTQETASVLIAAGGITVLVMPFLASVVLHTIDAEPVLAIKEIKRHPKQFFGVLKSHMEIEREKSRIEKHVMTSRKKARKAKDAESQTDPASSE